MKGRRLSFDQSAKLIAMASEACHVLSMVNVTAANSNQEAQMYATDFVKAFKAAGCTTDLLLPIPGLRPDVIGVHIGVTDITNVPPAAIELSKMLSVIGIKFMISPMEPGFIHSPVALVIGAK